jgi:hypothetical protein
MLELYVHAAVHISRQQQCGTVMTVLRITTALLCDATTMGNSYLHCNAMIMVVVAQLVTATV